MVTNINQVSEKLNRLFVIFFEEDHTISEAEKYFSEVIRETVGELVGCYLEQKDARLKADKRYRKEQGMTVQRIGDWREELTTLGVIRYRRTYYKVKDKGYSYPIDMAAGLEPYQRISDNVCQMLVSAAVDMPYSKASRYVTGGQVSKQTVMAKIRQSEPIQQPVVARKQVSELHIDADEDHVALQKGGRNVQVPLIVVYEGIQRIGKRNRCINSFAISEYGKTSEELWEQVYDEIDRRYDMENVRIYIHGDGASWIKYSRNLFPNCQFVLDPYHRNKALKKAVSGLSEEERSEYTKRITETFKKNDIYRFMELQAELAEKHADRIETILEGTNYLLDNFDAISVWYTNPEAADGGATEPHVSHVLSSRLSSRPLGWSEATLKPFAPILAAKNCVYIPKRKAEGKTEVKQKPYTNINAKDGVKRPFIPNSLGMPHPDIALTDTIFGQTGKKIYSLLNPESVLF